MATTVIHIKDAPKDWKTNKDYVYCGRSGKGLSSIYGNPFVAMSEKDRNIVCDKFDIYFFLKLTFYS